MINEIQKINSQGILKYTLIDVESGNIVEEHEQKNLVVTAGLNAIRTCFNSGTGLSLTHFGIGAGAGSTTAVSASQTDLQGATKTRAALDSKNASTDATLVCMYYLGGPVGNGLTYNEAGLFSASSGGTMYNRTVLSNPIVKTASIAVSFVWTLTWAAI